MLKRYANKINYEEKNITMLDNKHITIPKKVDTNDDLDFEFLRKEGINYIEKLGSKLWTDYNSHDPGISILEVLSYAITDLGMRTNLNMEDILASDSNEHALHTQFIKATEILPSAPLTHSDYRKLFLSIGDSLNLKRPIKNCWLVPYKETIYSDCKTGELSYEKGTGDAQHFNVKGLYKLLLDVDEDIVGDCDRSGIHAAIYNVFNENRNLCEDLVEIEEVENQDVAICAKIEVEREVDEERVHATVLHKLEQYFAPEVNFYSLNQMLDKGYTTDEVLEGPLLDNGIFIDTKELEKSQLRTELRLSDIIREIMSIDGVKEIKEISVNQCGGSVSTDNPWVLCLEEGKKPVLCDLSSFSYSKGTLPLNLNKTKVEQYLNEIKAQEALLIENAQTDGDIPLPKGNYYDIDSYKTILNEFPDTYGVGSFGIVSESTPEREALAKQLKGYLLFFDQILASYFKHLGKVKEILSVSGSLKRTYFTQALKDVKGFEELVSDDYTNNNEETLTDLLFEEIDNNAQRRNEVLNHLLARFAENFSDYVFIMKELYGNSVDEIVLRDKEDFLKDYEVISKTRGSGYNYNAPVGDLWNTTNVSGVQKRIARLLGLKNYERRNISDSPVNIIPIVDDQSTDNNSDVNYAWEIEDVKGDILLYSFVDLEPKLKDDGQYDIDPVLASEINSNPCFNPYSSSENTYDYHKGYQIEHVAFTNLYTAVFNAIQVDAEEINNVFEKPVKDGDFIGHIKILQKDGKYSFKIVNNLQEKLVIARSNKCYNIDELRLALIDLLEYLKHDFTEEGIFLVENILLKPSFKSLEINPGGIGCMIVQNSFIVDYKDDIGSDVGEGAFMNGCEGDCENELLDPYSYRVTIVLPGYSYRFSDPDFREYAEKVIRQELPAHVLAKICWVGDRRSDLEKSMSNLTSFEETYEQFLKDKSSGSSEDLLKSTKDLIDTMSELYNIYRPGRLLDCGDEDDTLDGRIILGQSNI